MYTYAKDYAHSTFVKTILKYSIGLPRLIINKLTKEKDKDLHFESNSTNESRPIMISKEEESMLKVISRNVTLSVEKKEGYLVLTVKGIEPIQTAELALKAQMLLQDEVTRFRTEKAQNQLDYIQARYDEIKKEAETYQAQLAAVKDRSQNMPTTRSRIEQERLQSKYNVANTVYSEMSKQLEQAKMQVKMDTPVLTVIQPVTVPNKPSNSRAKTIIIWTFLGGILGCGIVLGKSYLPKLMASFKKEEEQTTEE